MAHEHPTWRRLVDHHEDRLSGPWRTRTEEHLDAGCADCEAQLATVAALTADLAAGPLAAPPAAVARRARRLFAAARFTAAVDRVKTLVARLVFDQWITPAPALRGGTGAARRLLWTVADFEIVLTLVREGVRWELQGQILPAADDGETAPAGDVTLLSGAGFSWRAPLDAQGSFVFDGVAGGALSLAAVVDGRAVRIPTFIVD